MGIRRTIASIILGPPEVSEADLRRVQSELGQQRSTGGADPDTAAQIAKLEKKLNMAMGAIQAATAQIMSLKKDVQEVASTAAQAGQHATTARATAEATADGLNGVEEQLASLVEKLGTPSAAPAKKAKAKPKKASAPEICSVDGCNNKHRARGFCAKHYQQSKRGTL